MHKLETLYLFGGSKVSLGSFGVIGVKFWFSLKMHYLFYVTKYIHVIYTLESHSRDQQGNWGQSGVDVSKPAGYAVCDGNMSSFFFFFCQHFVDLYLRHDLTNFDQTWSQVPVDHPIYMGSHFYVIWPEWDQRLRRGHRGQEGQKLKNATPQCLFSTPIHLICTTGVPVLPVTLKNWFCKTFLHGQTCSQVFQ